jgi:hypothetical protein
MKTFLIDVTEKQLETLKSACLEAQIYHTKESRKAKSEGFYKQYHEEKATDCESLWCMLYDTQTAKGK